MDRPAVQYAGRGESHAERIVMELSQQRSAQPYGLLYPIMLIAAIAVIVFSILGIASIAGWMPGALSAAATGGAGDRTLPVAVRASATFDCGELPGDRRHSHARAGRFTGHAYRGGVQFALVKGCRVA